MSRTPRILLPLALVALCFHPSATAAPVQADPVVYEVAAVDGKLLHLAVDGDRRLAAGARLAGGTDLATGWFSSADLAVPREGARFHLRSRTRVHLLPERPGVLLRIERGRLRALFGALAAELAGSGEETGRRIETPSAVLAVRGTEYGVAVGRDGATTLVVFEGVVEVLGLAGPPGPVRVGAGHALHVRRGQPPGTPFRHGVTPGGWDRGAMPPMGPPEGAPGAGRPGAVEGPAGEGHQGPPESGPPDDGRQGPPEAGAQGAGQQGPPDAGAPGAAPHGSPQPGPSGKGQQGPPPSPKGSGPPPGGVSQPAPTTGSE